MCMAMGYFARTAISPSGAMGSSSDSWIEVYDRLVYQSTAADGELLRQGIREDHRQGPADL
jgi:hypothetical protein